MHLPSPVSLQQGYRGGADANRMRIELILLGLSWHILIQVKVSTILSNTQIWL
jgi:hypothetical protein